MFVGLQALRLYKMLPSINVLCFCALIALCRSDAFSRVALGASREVEIMQDEIKFPYGFKSSFYEATYEFRCSVSDAEDEYLLYKKAFHFCDAIISGLPYSWTLFYLEPQMCQDDVVRFTKHLYSQMKNQKWDLGDVSNEIFPISKYLGCGIRSWLWDLSQFSMSVTSQRGQDGLLQKIFSAEGIGPGDKYYVEIGFNSFEHDGGSGSNTYNLYKNGWSGLLLDIEFENPKINLRRHAITADNVVYIFDKYNVPLEPDYVSIDIDSQDLWVLRAIVSSGKYRPRVITVEYNPNLSLGSTLTMSPQSTVPYDKDILYGAGAGAIKLVAEEFGYTLVYVERYTDVFLIRTDLLHGACPLPFILFYDKRGKTHNCISKSERMFQWVEYGAWIASGGDVERSKAAAVEQLMLSLQEKSPSERIFDAELKCFGIDVHRFS